MEPAGAVDIPQGPAQAWLLADLDSGRILASRNPYDPHAPASTIKALLAMVVLDQLPLSAVIVVKPTNTDVECSCVGVKDGRAYTVRQLLDGLMLVSGNDAANTLAEGLGGYQAAVARMNAKAVALGARNTHASSPSGLDGPGHATIGSPNTSVNSGFTGAAFPFGTTFAATFTAPGTYHYICALHDDLGMKGTIVVLP